MPIEQNPDLALEIKKHILDMARVTKSREWKPHEAFSERVGMLARVVATNLPKDAKWKDNQELNGLFKEVVAKISGENQKIQSFTTKEGRKDYKVFSESLKTDSLLASFREIGEKAREISKNHKDYSIMSTKKIDINLASSIINQEFSNIYFAETDRNPRRDGFSSKELKFVDDFSKKAVRELLEKFPEINIDNLADALKSELVGFREKQKSFEEVVTEFAGKNNPIKQNIDESIIKSIGYTIRSFDAAQNKLVPFFNEEDRTQGYKALRSTIKESLTDKERLQDAASEHKNVNINDVQSTLKMAVEKHKASESLEKASLDAVTRSAPSLRDKFVSDSSKLMDGIFNLDGDKKVLSEIDAISKDRKSAELVYDFIVEVSKNDSIKNMVQDGSLTPNSLLKSISDGLAKDSKLSGNLKEARMNLLINKGANEDLVNELGASLAEAFMNLEEKGQNAKKAAERLHDTQLLAKGRVERAVARSDDMQESIKPKFEEFRKGARKVAEDVRISRIADKLGEEGLKTLQEAEDLINMPYKDGKKIVEIEEQKTKPEIDLKETVSFTGLEEKEEKMEISSKTKTVSEEKIAKAPKSHDSGRETGAAKFSRLLKRTASDRQTMNNSPIINGPKTKVPVVEKREDPQSVAKAAYGQLQSALNGAYTQDVLVKQYSKAVIDRLSDKNMTPEKIIDGFANIDKKTPEQRKAIKDAIESVSKAGFREVREVAESQRDNGKGGRS